MNCTKPTLHATFKPIPLIIFSLLSATIPTVSFSSLSRESEETQDERVQPLYATGFSPKKTNRLFGGEKYIKVENTPPSRESEENQNEEEQPLHATGFSPKKANRLFGTGKYTKPAPPHVADYERLPPGAKCMSLQEQQAGRELALKIKELLGIGIRSTGFDAPTAAKLINKVLFPDEKCFTLTLGQKLLLLRYVVTQCNYFSDRPRGMTEWKSIALGNCAKIATGLLLCSNTDFLESFDRVDFSHQSESSKFDEFLSVVEEFLSQLGAEEPSELNISDKPRKTIQLLTPKQEINRSTALAKKTISISTQILEQFYARMLSATKWISKLDSTTFHGRCAIEAGVSEMTMLIIGLLSVFEISISSQDPLRTSLKKVLRDAITTLIEHQAYISKDAINAAFDSFWNSPLQIKSECNLLSPEEISRETPISALIFYFRPEATLWMLENTIPPENEEDELGLELEQS